MNGMQLAMSAPRITPQQLQALIAARAQNGAPVQPQFSPRQSAAPAMPPSPGLPLQSVPRAAVPLDPQQQSAQMVGGQLPPGLAQFARVANPQQPGQQMRQPRLSPQELAHLGRYGDSLVAHLTPGEIQVPPEVQTPHVLEALQKAFGHVGASPAQFTAGSPASSTNPASGMPEYDLWSAIIPAVAGVAGAVVAPELLPAEAALWAAPAASAAGAAIGTGVGSLATGSTPTQALYSGLGAGAGSFVGGGGLGSLFGSSTTAGEAAAASQAATAATNTAPLGGWVDTTAGAAGSGVASSAGSSGASSALSPTLAPAQNGFSLNSSATDGLGLTKPEALPADYNPLGGAGKQTSIFGVPTYAAPKTAMLGSTIGAMLGSALAPAAKTTSPNLPAGFTTPKPPTNPAFNQLLGNSQSQTPNFAGYNPYTAAAGQAYNWYAPAGTNPVSSTPGTTVNSATPNYAAYPFPQPVIT